MRRVEATGEFESCRSTFFSCSLERDRTMPQPARLAIGSVQPSASRFPVLWGLLDLWRRHGVQVQPFRSHAELASSPGAEVATGRPYRHLDCGMMFPRLCGHLLQYGARGCDVAVVDGLFAPRRQEADADRKSVV